MRSRFFLTYRFASKDDKPYSTTFRQISLKSNEAFSNYAQKTSFFTLIPYSPRIKIFFKKTKTSLSSHYQVTILCQKSESSYERILRYAPNVRTNGRRLNHKSQPLRGGPKRGFWVQKPPGGSKNFLTKIFFSGHRSDMET